MNLFQRAFFNKKEDLEKLDKSSRFSLVFMKRTNLISVGIFLVAILIKFILWLVK